MPIDTKAILRQIDSLLEEWNNLQQDYSNAPDFQVTTFVTRLISAIERLTPFDSPYRVNVQRVMKTYHVYSPDAANMLAGIFLAIRGDYEAGYFHSVQELIHADVFGDFLEMADYFLSEGYKAPAAVIAGGVLEEHLRKLCQKAGIATTFQSASSLRPKKADGMNSELAGAGIYTKLDQKSVTAWLDLRNNAAHGKYSEYTKEQVDLMVQGIRDFISRHPA